jgi:carboxypeptidase Q
MKRSIVLLTLTAFLFVNTAAQEFVDATMDAKIRDEGLNRSQVLKTFEHFTEAIGPRLTGSPAVKAADDYAVKVLQGWGITNAHLETWEFGRGWQLEKSTIELVEPRYTPLIGYPEAWSASTPGEIVGTPVFIGNKTLAELQTMKGQLKGAIVLSQPLQDSFERVDRKQPTLFDEPVAIGQPRPPAGSAPFITPAAVNKAIFETGAAAILRPNRGEHGTLFVLGRDNGDAAMPSMTLSAEHYNMLVRMLEMGLKPKVRVNIQTKYFTDDKNAYNVIADIPGTDKKDEIVMIGAHLDSWHAGTGAADNADGAAVAIEAMRILNAIGAKPRRTIRMGVWNGEEEGLLGSQAYVNKYLAGDANKSARDKFDVYFNQDPGTGPIYGWYLENNSAIKPIFDAWLEPFKDLGARRNIWQPIGSTDHVSFNKVGVLGFNAVQDYDLYDTRIHHTNMDTFERVKEADLKECAVVLAAFAYNAATRTDKLPTGQASSRAALVIK